MKTSEAIEYLNDVRNGIHIPAPGIERPLLNDKEKEAVDLAISALKKLEQERWIPVKERPPEKEGCYLVTVKNDHERRYSKTAWYCGDGWFARQDIIAWRLTPEPYTEEKA